jgi:hypothetical protein
LQSTGGKLLANLTGTAKHLDQEHIMMEDVMRKTLLSIALGLTLMIALLGAFQIARSQTGSSGSGEKLLAQETDGTNTREIYGPADSSGNAPQASAPDIGFIDSPTSTCYQPDPAQDTCYINWYYISVSASPNYMISMTVAINAIGQVIRYQGFFQTSMYAPYNMQDRGIKVACGTLGAGGNPYWGNAYAYTIRARDSAGLSSANYGTVYCPAKKP